jgi:hypothetical protein
MPPRRGPNELTYEQMQEGVDFDEDELAPGEEADRARQPSDPREQLIEHQEEQ